MPPQFRCLQCRADWSLVSEADEARVHRIPCPLCGGRITPRVRSLVPLALAVGGLWFAIVAAGFVLLRGCSSAPRADQLRTSEAFDDEDRAEFAREIIDQANAATLEGR